MHRESQRFDLIVVFGAGFSERKAHIIGVDIFGGQVVAVLNDVFGVQSRGGCACAGPYAQWLLGMDEEFHC